MPKKSVVGTTSVGVFSSLLAFLGVVSCCGMPIAAGVLAWLGIGAAQLSFLAQYRPLFIGLAIISLSFGFWRTYFKLKKTCCATRAEKGKKPKSNLFQKIFLWIGASVVVAILFIGS